MGQFPVIGLLTIPMGEVKEPKVAPYGMKQLYLTDPDGYLLCFQWLVGGSA